MTIVVGTGLRLRREGKIVELVLVLANVVYMLDVMVPHKLLYKCDNKEKKIASLAFHAYMEIHVDILTYFSFAVEKFDSSDGDGQLNFWQLVGCALCRAFKSVNRLLDWVLIGIRFY